MVCALAVTGLVVVPFKPTLAMMESMSAFWVKFNAPSLQALDVDTYVISGVAPVFNVKS